MALATDIEVLRGLEIFSSFTREQLRLLAFGCQRLSFPAGTELYHSNQSADGAYVILSGKVELTIELNQTRHKMEIFAAGSILGELSMITRNRRVGTALAIEAVDLMKIRRDTMYRVIDEFPDLAAVLYDHIADSVIKMGPELDRVMMVLPPDSQN